MAAKKSRKLFGKKSPSAGQKFQITGKNLNIRSLLNGKLWFYITKNIMMVFLVVSLLIIYISLRLNYQSKLGRIEQLKSRLEQTRSLVVVQTSELVAKTKQSDILELIKQHQLDLEVSATPPYTFGKK